MTSDLNQKLETLRIERRDEVPERRSGLWVGVVAGLLGVAAVAAFLLWPRAVPVRTIEVSEARDAAGGVEAVLNASGYVTARRQATVSSKITGKVMEVLIEEGMKVDARQVLARLDDSQASLSLELAQAELAAAEKGLAETEANLHEAELRRGRIRDLAREGIAPQGDVDAVEAETAALAARIAAQREQIRAADRSVALARQNLEDTVIRAPFAGVAISKNAQPGEMISPISAGGSFTRTGISTIVDMASLEIEVDVNEAYIQRVRPSQRVTATLDAYPDWTIPGHVITSIPAAERDKATVKVRIGFDALDPRILPDMGVKVAFLEEHEGGDGRRVVRVPRAAVRGSAGAEFVWVVGTSGLERRAIRVAAGGSDPAEVVAGLAAGERVVIEGPAELAAGTRVVERGER